MATAIRGVYNAFVGTNGGRQVVITWMETADDKPCGNHLITVYAENAGGPMDILDIYQAKTEHDAELLFDKAISETCHEQGRQSTYTVLEYAGFTQAVEDFVSITKNDCELSMMSGGRQDRDVEISCDDGVLTLKDDGSAEIKVRESLFKAWQRCGGLAPP